jgi:hypothetical protein
LIILIILVHGQDDCLPCRIRISLTCRSPTGNYEKMATTAWLPLRSLHY